MAAHEPSAPVQADEMSPVKKQDGMLNALLGVVLVGTLGIAIMNGQPKGDPNAAAAAFAGATSYSDAASTASSQNKPVFVFATADWCVPCQSFKGTTLADQTVQDRLAADTVSYLLDVTSSPPASAEDARLASELRVNQIPAYYLIDSGEVIAQGSGMLGKDGFLRWLEQGIDRGVAATAPNQ